LRKNVICNGVILDENLQRKNQPSVFNGLEYLSKLGLNERQIKAVLYVKVKDKISNNIYQNLFSVSKATATRDLHELSEKWNLLRKEGNTGAGTIYLLRTH
jgi:ATP-dependent DNA helicase RecG